MSRVSGGSAGIALTGAGVQLGRGGRGRRWGEGRAVTFIEGRLVRPFLQRQLQAPEFVLQVIHRVRDLIGIARASDFFQARGSFHSAFRGEVAHGPFQSVGEAFEFIAPRMVRRIVQGLDLLRQVIQE